MRQLLTNSAVVLAMLATNAVLAGRGVSFGWRVIAMGTVSALLLGAVTLWRRRSGA